MRDEIIMSADCGSFKTHGPHVIRKGILGLFRLTCSGYQHKHFMQLRHNPHIKAMGGGYYFGQVVFWKCYCGTPCSRNKDDFYNQLLGKES